MIGTLLKRVTVRTLDVVVDRGRRSSRGPVRQVASVLDSVRGVVGLDEVRRAAPVPDWDGQQPDQPMWETDRKKLRKHQLDKGILKDEDTQEQAEAEAAAPGAAVEIYFKRGCPYTRAALDLLREREIPFVEKDVTMEEATRGWLKIVTGHSTTPQIFIHGEPIGGYEELRALDQAGTLRARVGGVAGEPEAAADDGEAEVTVADLADRLDDGQEVLLVDVRTDAEVRSGMLAHAVHIPLDQLEARADELDPEGVWIAYCRSGQRSLTAARQLEARGFRSVVSLAGGIEAWRAAGREVSGYGDTEARRTPSRRVRLTVLHPERSPFEGLADEYEGETVTLEGDELIARVREVLDECRPLVQADGGDIELLDVTSDTVHLQLTGNCIGCPSSQATLKQGIERRLQSRIPQIKQIQSPQLA
jgi:rhodanese-related sulfurtransferase/Fe-S cluster biogenesis protein NfuA/glutaredoxin